MALAAVRRLARGFATDASEVLARHRRTRLARAARQRQGQGREDPWPEAYRAPPPPAPFPRQQPQDVDPHWTTPVSAPEARGIGDAKALASVVNRRAVLVTREVEWGNLVLGFEQANRYTLRDEGGAIIGYMAEEGQGLGSVLTRQMLATHRPFKATVMDTAGRVVFRVSRPFYFIESGMEVQDARGETIGQVKERWHLWRRHYDLFWRGSRWGTIRGGLWAWEFEVKDEGGRSVAWINRKWPQGLGDLGREVFTDAGKYVVHLGEVSRGDVPRDEQSKGLALREGLGLDERCVALAAAMSIDFDHFSRHSHAGFGVPLFFPMPMPMPMPMPPADVGGGDGGLGGEGGGEGLEGTGAGAGAGAGAWAGGPAGGYDDAANPQGPDFVDEDPDWDVRDGGDDFEDPYGYDEGEYDEGGTDFWGDVGGGEDDGGGGGGGGGGLFGGFFDDS